MKKKVFSVIISAVAAAAALGALSACDSAADAAPNDFPTDTGLSVKSAYEEAASLGYGGTLDEFDASLAAASNSVGQLTVANVRVNADGDLIVSFTNGSYANLGKIGCVHSYSAWSVGAAPTCASLGYNVRTCTACGETDYEFLPAKGHTVAEYSHTQSMHSYFCSDCATYIQEEHSFDDSVCNKCGYEADFTVGLKYAYDEESDSYSVKRTVKDKIDKADKIVVPSEYRNKPVTAIGNNAFQRFEASEIVLPDTITKIELGAFMYCIKLTKVNIPDGVTEIKALSFVHCDELTELTLPKSLTSIGIRAFMMCDKLAKINIPDGLTAIEGYAFANCTTLAEISIPDSVTELGGGAFLSCSSLRSVKLPAGLTTINNRLFESCTELTEITLPETLNVIGSRAFYNCTSLRSVVIPDGVTEIMGSAFYNCTELSELKLPDSLTVIGGWAFANTKITEIALPDGVTKLSANVFNGCSELTELTVGAGLTEICAGALADCPKLNKIIFGGTTAEWKAVSKASGWKTPDNIITDLFVECADGTLEYIW